MPISTIDTQRNPQLTALAAALNQSSVVLGQALNNAIQRASQDDQTQLTQENATLTEQQRNIANERAERFDKRNRAQFISEFGRKLDRDDEDDSRFQQTFGLTTDKFTEQKRSTGVQEGFTGRRVSVSEQQADTQETSAENVQERFEGSLAERKRQFDEGAPQRAANVRSTTAAANQRILSTSRATLESLEDQENKDFSEAILQQFGFDSIGTDDFSETTLTEARQQLGELPEPELTGVINASKKSEDLRLQQLAGEAAGVLAVRKRSEATQAGGAEGLSPAEVRQRTKIQGERQKQFTLARRLRQELNNTEDEDRQISLTDKINAAESAVKGLDVQLENLKLKATRKGSSTVTFDPNSGVTEGF